MNNILYNLFQHKLSKYVKKTEIDDVISEKIVDNLVSEDSDKALSAKQGKKLKDSIDAVVASGGGDMLSVDYDEDRDGIIDRATADKNGNDIDKTYATKAEVEEQAHLVEEHINSASKMYATKTEFEQHVHSASDIDYGVLSILHGGTGAATAEEAIANLGIDKLLDEKTNRIRTYTATRTSANEGSEYCVSYYDVTMPELTSETVPYGYKIALIPDKSSLYVEGKSHGIYLQINNGYESYVYVPESGIADSPLFIAGKPIILINITHPLTEIDGVQPPPYISSWEECDTYLSDYAQIEEISYKGTGDDTNANLANLGYKPKKIEIYGGNMELTVIQNGSCRSHRWESDCVYNTTVYATWTENGVIFSYINTGIGPAAIMNDAITTYRVMIYR